MRKLHWDSEFWGINIFHLDNSKTLNINKETDEPYLIQALPNISDVKFISFLEQRGFFFKESKITLEKKALKNIQINGSQYNELSLEDLKSYHNIFFDLYGKNTRYDIFACDKVNEFYYKWAINSTNGEMDDECIGYFIADKLAGFITYRLSDNNIIIGLLGILPEYQGRGISQLLLNYVNNIAVKNSIKSVRVSTQGKNTNAINAYIKNGYRFYSIDHWYYLIEGDL